MSTVDVASATSAKTTGGTRSSANGPGADDGFSRIFDTVARQSPDNASRHAGQQGHAGSATDADSGPSQAVTTDRNGSAPMRLNGAVGQPMPDDDHARGRGDDTTGPTGKGGQATTASLPEGRQAADGSGSVDDRAQVRTAAEIKAATEAQRATDGGKLAKSETTLRTADGKPQTAADGPAIDPADDLTRLLGVAGGAEEDTERLAASLAPDQPETDDAGLSEDGSSLESAGNRPGTNPAPTGANDLTQLLGFAAMPMREAQDTQGPGFRTALRRHPQPQLPGAVSADMGAEQPRTVRIAVTGRETHFAPVNLPAATDHASAALPADEALPADAGRRQAAVPDIRTVADTVAAARLTVEKAGNETQRDPLPAGMQTGDVQAVPAGDGTATGTLVRLADQIVAQARELAAPAGSAATAAQAHQSAHAGGPVRILRLQLQPEELGLVTARLRIVAGVLELRLTADRQQSVEVLKKDSDGLLEALRRAGYTAEIASIEFARPASSAQQSPANPSGQSHAQGFAGESGGNGSNNAGHTPDQHNQREDADRQSHNQPGTGTSTTPVSDDAQAIYL